MSELFAAVVIEIHTFQSGSSLSLFPDLQSSVDLDKMLNPSIPEWFL
jgi:hypothetical protein